MEEFIIQTATVITRLNENNKILLNNEKIYKQQIAELETKLTAKEDDGKDRQTNGDDTGDTR